MLKEDTLAKSMRSPETPISFDNPMGGGSHDNRREPSELPRLTPAQYRVLGIIAASGGNPITKSDIARTAGCVVHTVDRAMRRLCEAGLIERVYNHDTVGGQVGNSYRLRPRQGEGPRERIRPDP